MGDNTHCRSSANLSPSNRSGKMSPYERDGDNEQRGTKKTNGSKPGRQG